jgi:hypothetical protein
VRPSYLIPINSCHRCQIFHNQGEIRRLLYGVWTEVGSDRCSSIIQWMVIFCSLVTKMKVLVILLWIKCLVTSLMIQVSHPWFTYSRNRIFRYTKLITTCSEESLTVQRSLFKGNYSRILWINNPEFLNKNKESRKTG